MRLVWSVSERCGDGSSVKSVGKQDRIRILSKDLFSAPNLSQPPYPLQTKILLFITSVMCNGAVYNCFSYLYTSMH